jgi:CRP-like cAMP-binding protein
MVERLGTRMRVQPGRVLITAGERGAESFIVLSGFASCLVAGTEVALFGAGDIFGEVAVLDGGPRTATVVAETEMELLVLTIDELDALIRTSPTVARRMLRTLGGRLRLANTSARV